MRVRGYILLENRLGNYSSTWEQTYRHTDTQKNIHKGNNNKIKYAGNITALKTIIFKAIYMQLDVYFTINL